MPKLPIAFGPQSVGQGRSLGRREFLKSTAATTAAAAAAATAPAVLRGAAARGRPMNLLFLWTDEQRPDTMAVYGNTKIQAPALNRLAEESVVFERAYVSQPVCTPSRSTVMTGLWPHASGLTGNNIPLPAAVPCVPEMVAGRGYATGYMGKWHLGDEIFAQHGFAEWQGMEDGYSTWYTPERRKGAMSAYYHWLRGLGYEGKSFSRDFAAKLPIEHCKPKFLETQAVDFLRRHRDEPFMLYVNFLEPHPPYTGPLDKLYGPDGVDVPANLDDPMEDDEPAYYRAKAAGGGKPKSTADWRALIARYWALVTQVDRSVGAILKALEDLGLAENTLVVYTSDHGDMMGSHQMLGKTVSYEEAMRVPWLMRIPQLGRKQRIVRAPVSHVDLVPTLLDLLGLETGVKLPGRSLRPAILGGRPAEDHVIVEWHIPQDKGGKSSGPADGQPAKVRDCPWRAVVSPDGWKLVLRKADKCQLFNLTADPGEMMNLFYTGRHADVIARLTARLRQWQGEAKDALDVYP